MRTGHGFHDAIGESDLTAGGHHNPNGLAVFIRVLTDNGIETSEPCDKLSSITVRNHDTIDPIRFISLFLQEAFHRCLMMRACPIPGLTLTADVAMVIVVPCVLVLTHDGGWRDSHLLLFNTIQFYPFHADTSYPFSPGKRVPTEER